jgi:hypothetical protein
VSEDQFWNRRLFFWSCKEMKGYLKKGYIKEGHKYDATWKIICLSLIHLSF